MAIPLHLELLSKEAETWNSWIHSHPAVVADFSEDHLEHLNFDNVHLVVVNFVGANLSQATLQGADLSWAILRHAVFIKANLREAFLQGGHFSKAVFRWPDLQAIDLDDVNVRAAIFV
jgi:uncharacterized protein YjbI with pentapeptide repeats